MSTSMDTEGEPDATQDVPMEDVTAVKDEDEQPSADLNKVEETAKQTYKSFKYVLISQYIVPAVFIAMIVQNRT